MTTITKKTTLLHGEGPMRISIGTIKASPYTAIIRDIVHPEGLSGYLEIGSARIVNVSVKYPGGQVFTSQYNEEESSPGKWVGTVMELGPAEVGSVFEFTFTPDPAKPEYDQTPIVRTVTIEE